MPMKEARIIPPNAGVFDVSPCHRPEVAGGAATLEANTWDEGPLPGRTFGRWPELRGQRVYAGFKRFLHLVHSLSRVSSGSLSIFRCRRTTSPSIRVAWMVSSPQ